MIEFARTVMGAKLFDGTLPRIAKALERIATALEAQNAANGTPAPKAMTTEEPK